MTFYDLRNLYTKDKSPDLNALEEYRTLDFLKRRSNLKTKVTSKKERCLKECTYAISGISLNSQKYEQTFKAQSDKTKQYI